MTSQELKYKAAKLRIDTVKSISRAGSGHTGSALSCLDILVALYYGQQKNKPLLNIDPKKPGWDKQDYVVLSKGAACPAQYAILADLGFFSKNELNHYREFRNLLQAYPNRRIPGVVSTAGPVADAFAMAAGLAVCLKMEKANNKVFAVLGDSELQDGLTWEAIMSAAHYRCDNLVAIVDNSGLQVDGYIRGVMNVQPIQDKFESFGWKVFHVLDGHDFEELSIAINKAVKVKRQPVCIWAHTVSANGIPFAEGKPSYFAAPFSEAELDEAMPFLEAQLEELKL